MERVIHRGRQLFMSAVSTVAILASSNFSNAILKWGEYWWSNRTQILMLTGINAGITLGSELGVRQLYANILQSKETFLIHTPTSVRIHKQSIFNIFMTIFTSLLGGPVFFIRTKWKRFLFFIHFGAVVSVLGQYTGNFLQEGIFYFSLGRLAFDIFYNGTIKYFMFEIVRPAILRVQQKFFATSALRVGQDFVTTLIRVAILNVLGFSK